MKKSDYYYLTKTELAKRIAIKMPDLTIQEVKDGVDIIIERMLDEMENKGEIHVWGLGKIYLRYVESRIFHHPTLRKIITVPRRAYVKFAPCRKLYYKIKYSYNKPPLRLNDNIKN